MVQARALLAEALVAARRREFRFLWLANSLANFAYFFELAVLTWLALTLTGSPWQVAVVGFWRHLPLLAVGPFGGVLADLFDRRRVAIATQIASGCVTFAVALLLIADRLEFWQLASSSFVLGLIIAVDSPSRRALVMDMVARKEVVNAAALDTATTMASRIPGPLLGGVLIAVLGLGGCYVALTLAYFAAGLAALGLRPVPPLGRGSVRRAVRDFVEGLAYLLRRPAICAALGVTLVSNLLVLPYQQFLPVFARDLLFLDPVRYGTLGAVMWVGGFVVTVALAVWAHRLRPGLTFLFGPLVICLGLLPFAATSDYVVALASLFVVGCGQGVYTCLQGTVVLLRTEAALRGRMMGLLVFGIGLWPVGMLLMGAVIDWIGARAAVMSAAVVALLALGALVAWRPDLHLDGT